MTRSRKTTYHLENKTALDKLCVEEGYEVEWLNIYQARIMSGITIVDIWTPRMKYNVLNIDGVEQPARYGQMAHKFDKIEVKTLLEKGRL